jgi:bla regulator protein BlaR1
MDVGNAFEFVGSVARSTALAALPVCAVVVGITGLGRRWLPAWARHALWTLVLVRLLLPAGVASPLSLQTVWSAFTTDRVVDTTPLRRLHAIDVDLPDVFRAEPGRPADATRDSIQFRRSRWPASIGPMWSLAVAVGGLAVAAWTLWTTLRLRRWLQRGTDCCDPEWLALLEEGRRLFGVRGRVSLRTVPGLMSPATCGWWRPLILLPVDAAALSEAERRHVLWHELAHIRRGDGLSNLLPACIRCLHWWNPVFWWVERCWLAERELACDALVMQRLGIAHRADYGRTLLMFLERVSSQGVRWSPSDVPGFVWLLGAKPAFRRRLAALAHAGRREGSVTRWLAWGLLALLAVAGLTEVMPPRPAVAGDQVLGLPSGAVWRLSTGTKSLVVYDLSENIARMRRDDAALGPEMAAESLRQNVSALVQPPTPHASLPSPSLQPSTNATSPVQLDGHRLIVRATSGQHEAIQHLLSHWREHGQQQICFEVRFLSTPRELSELLPIAGGEVVGAAWQKSDSSSALSIDPVATVQATSQQSTQCSVPAYIRMLSPAEREVLLENVQRDARSNALYAPKITVFEGLSASVHAGTSRPFVTGLTTLPDGKFQPQITIVPEGLTLQVIGITEEGRLPTRLQVRYGFAELLDVETLTIRSQPQDLKVQVPHVRESVVESAARLGEGHSLLLAPLRRDPRGHLHICVISPQRLGVKP